MKVRPNICDLQIHQAHVTCVGQIHLKILKVPDRQRAQVLYKQSAGYTLVAN